MTTDYRSIWPAHWRDPVSPQKRWDFQKHYHGCPWGEIEEPADVRTEREARESRNGAYRFKPRPEPTPAAEPSAPAATPKSDRWRAELDAKYGKPTVDAELFRLGEFKDHRVDARKQQVFATHESAHALLAVHHNVRINKVVCTLDLSGYCDHDNEAEPFRMGPGLDNDAAMLRYGSYILAGIVGEEIAFGSQQYRDVGENTDESIIGELVAVHYRNNPEGAKKFYAEARALARKVLTARWGDVERVAAVLQDKHRLTGDELAKLLPPVAMQVRRVELPLQTRAAPLTTGGDAIQICWGSGEVVKRGGYDPYYEDLPAANADLSWMNTGKCPLLDSHNSSRTSDVLGVVKAGSAFVKDGRGYASITLGSNAPAGIKDGTLRNISIGYSIGAMKLNGKAADGLPIYTVESYRILECSIVPVPADKGAEILRKYPAEVRG